MSKPILLAMAALASATLSAGPLAWPPVEARELAMSGGLLTDEMKDGGEAKRAYEVYAHGLRPEWGYAVPAQTNFVAVVPPMDGHRAGAPLVVLLHSAGCILSDGRIVRGTSFNHMSRLFCKTDPGIYTVPDDFYALFPDCGILGGDDWWWGSQCKAGAGFALSPCEKRVLAEIEWAVEKFGIDRNRIYMAGNSMGGSGTLGIGLRHGDVFAAIKANVPAGVEHARNRMGFGAEGRKGNLVPDPPVAIDYSAPNDSWSCGHEKLAADMRAHGYAYFLYWGSFGHSGVDRKVMPYNDLYNGLDWLNIRRDEAYPAFTMATTDEALPWPCDPKKSEKLPPGQVNGYFRWKNLSDTADGFEMELRLVSEKEAASKIFKIPSEATADLTLRRLQRFLLKPGEKVCWSFGASSGTVAADETGHLTIPALRFQTTPQRLLLRKSW